MCARVTLAVGLPYQIDRVTLAVGLSFCLRKCIKRVELFAFSKCQTNKDGHNTEMKQQN